MSFPAFSSFLVTAASTDYPSVRRLFKICGPYAISMQSLATDPIGSFTLSLTNLVVGSQILVESTDGSAVFYNAVTSLSSVTINLSVYAAGSPLNNLRVKVRKGSSSPFYQPYETLVTAVQGSQSIFVSQILDE